ncbi:MAG: DUF2937 family protein [Mesorhizobium sp.]
MPVLRNSVTVACGLAGALALSQAPEFAQQYRQRLGGALEELARVVSEFDEDAAANKLSRDEALATYSVSSEQFLKDRGERMKSTITRMETLAAQARWFETLPPVAKPVALARGYDGTLMAGLWRDYRPAAPLTLDGAVWAGAGFVAATSLFALLCWPFQAWSRNRRERRLAKHNAARLNARRAPARRASRG